MKRGARRARRTRETPAAGGHRHSEAQPGVAVGGFSRAPLALRLLKCTRRRGPSLRGGGPRGAGRARGVRAGTSKPTEGKVPPPLPRKWGANTDTDKTAFPDVGDLAPKARKTFFTKARSQRAPFFVYRRPQGTYADPYFKVTARSNLHRAPVGQGPSGPDWLAISFGFWSGRALATGTAWAGLCLIHHHYSAIKQRGPRRSVFPVL